MAACPTCARENPAEFAFCPACGTKLAAGAAHGPAGAAAPVTAPILTEERKVVTSLFCDLVGYTAHSEAVDHERIDELLRRYNALARRLVEAHGGVVEKFIGDAVLAVFGFPHAHEDDAERAVLVGLQLAAEAGSLMWPDGDAVEVRIGVNSGETYLHTDVLPASGETFLTGDAVNTAARLETAAPPGGVVVGELTHALTETAIAYTELEPLTLKGKSEPVRAWLAERQKQSRSRTGLRTTGKLDTPFLGRTAELRALAAAFDKAVAERRAQLRLVVGEPGIGKSRLVLELAHSLDRRPELITWRQGRCLAFGEGVAFWALGEIVKLHAGILDSDEVATVEQKLEAVLPEGDERPWLRQRLRPLLGLESAPSTQEESFAAWTAFLVHLASAGPTVLVFEDLHWAGEGMLAFVSHLASQELAAPLLLLGTARPELVAKHPDVFAPAPDVGRVILSPLGRKEAGRLVSALLDDRLAADVRAPVVERVGGNPLYAEEYVRLLLDRGLLARARGVLRLKEGAELPLPDTVQAVLAARLDTLPPDHKALLCDAAVFGESFWSGGVATLAAREAAEVERVLAALVERQLVRPTVSSTLEGEREYLFWHALARDVAYEQLPRRSRVRKHEEAALWIEDKAGERVSEVAELLAHHYVSALSLAEALQASKLMASLVAPCLRSLDLAGSRALVFDLTAAERHYARALALVSAEDPWRARLLAGWGMAVGEAGRDDEALPALREAIDQLRAAGEVRLAAEAMSSLSSILQLAGRFDESQLGYLAEAEWLEHEEPCAELVLALSDAAIAHGNLGRPHEAQATADRALRAAGTLRDSVGRDDPRLATYWTMALAARGEARCQLGDLGGLDDMGAAAEASVSLGTNPLSLRSFALAVHLTKGPPEAVAPYEKAADLFERQGMQAWAFATRLGLLDVLYDGGARDEVLAAWRDLVERAEDPVVTGQLPWIRSAIADVQRRRGEPVDVRPLLEECLADATRANDSFGLAGALLWSATFLTDEDPDAARRHMDELAAVVEPMLSSYTFYGVYALPEVLRTAHRVCARDMVERLTRWVEPRTPPQRCVRQYGDALLSEARGDASTATEDFAGAAIGWRVLGVPLEEGESLLGQGRCLLALGRAAEAASILRGARAVFERLEERLSCAATDALLARAVRCSSD